MKIASKGIENGRICDKFGSKGEQFTPGGMPSYSIPFEIHDAPEGTRSFALIFEDLDAIPVCGFSWIHWIAANVKETSVPENISISDLGMVQGVNSYHSCASELSPEEATGYGGPAPPDGPHMYDLKVFALDIELDLKRGFRLNEMMKKMRGHVLAHARVSAVYSPR
jgi:Raf kinase inhibitor-like protein, YbhB/YbcL family